MGTASTPAERGRAAEDAVADYLVCRGFAILARNHRLGRLELDIVARRGPLLVVVEVRTRGPGSYESAFASITWKKRARIVEATGRLLRGDALPLRLVQRVRIDAASVTFEGGRACVEYVEGAITR